MKDIKEFIKSKRETLSASSITTYNSILTNLYKKVFGEDSPYRKRLAPKAKIQKELKDRMDASEDNKAYKPKVEKKKSQVPTGPYGDTPYGGSSPYEGSSAYGGSSPYEGSSPYGDNPYGAQTTKKKRFKY